MFTAPGRALSACYLLALCFTGFSYRLVQLQVAQHEDYLKLAADAHGGRQTIYARRGVIQDASGWPLAQNEPVKTVVADCTLIKDAPLLARLLAPLLSMPESAVLEKLTRQRWSAKEGKNVPVPYVVLKKEVSETNAVKIGDLLTEYKIRSGAISFEQESIRVYPNGEMLCHVIGYTDHTSHGVEGVERSMDEYLRGHDGYRYTEHDRTGKEMVPYRGAERPARNGCNVRLTVDSQVQMIVESELQAAVKEFRPVMATSIVLRPNTGEIMAMASYPHFNLNQQEGVPEINRKNPAIMSIVEPGSTFKIVTTAGALTHKLVTPDTSIFCENGHFKYCGNTLNDHKSYGELTVNEILIHSSNVGVAKLGIQLGEQRLYDYIRRFGFGERTNIPLPGEIPGIIHPPHRWSKISITHVPMGQEVAATPIQVAMAMGAVANGGRLMMPQIVREITDSAGKPVVTYAPTEVRRVMPEKVSEQLRMALREVVSKKGTAQLAAVPGFTAAGKTGTAQKAGPNGTYLKDKYVCSFVGFLPAENPEFVCLVLLDSPNTTHERNFGGTTAGPVFARIAERTARYLNLEPSPELLTPNGAGNLAGVKPEQFRD